VENKWSWADPDPEAVAWRKAHKKRMRPYICKIDRRPLLIRWMPWVLAWFALALVAAGTL